MGEDSQITTLASIILGARGSRTLTESSLYDRVLGTEMPFISSFASYSDGRLHIVGSESRIGESINATNISIYLVEQRPYDPSFIPRTLPEERLVFERVDGRTTFYLQGEWEKLLGSLIQVAGS